MSEWCAVHKGWTDGPTVRVRSDSSPQPGITAVCIDCMASGRYEILGAVLPTDASAKAD